MSGSARAPASSAGTSPPTGETTVDLAEQAARRAIEAAGLKPEDIDFIAFGTTTPDLVFPNCGVLLQKRLGCLGVPAFSVETACAGFMYALSIADKYVRCGEAKRALVVGVRDTLAHDRLADRDTAILFADGAGAVVLEPSETAGILSTHLHADGRYHDMLYCGGGVFTGMRPKLTIIMAGREVFKRRSTSSARWSTRLLSANRLERSAIDWLVPHQANIRIVQATAAKLDMPMERVIVTVQDHGNTSAASVPLALDVGVRDGRIKRGEMLLLEAFGGGFTWGSALLRAY